jgi:hypothetical protein
LSKLHLIPAGKVYVDVFFREEPGVPVAILVDFMRSQLFPSRYQPNLALCIFPRMHPLFVQNDLLVPGIT